MQTEKLQILKDTFGDYRKERNEYLFYCPKCDHHKPKLSVNLEKNCFKCWVCDYTGRKVSRLVRSYGSFSEYKKWQQFEEHIEISEFDLLFNTFAKEETKALQLPEEFISLVNKNLPLSSLPVQQYLSRRKVTKADIRRFKIGYCGRGDYEGYLIVPSFNMEGEINFFVARNYSNHWRTYMNPKVPRNSMIFNELFLDFYKEIVVVEGVFDALNAGNNSVPLLGSTLSEKSKLMRKIVLHDTPVYIALDHDAEKKSIYMIKKLLEYGIETYKVNTSGFKDVGEMSKEEFKQRKENATLMNSENILLLEAMAV